MRSTRSDSGYSLVEIAIVLAISAILLVATFAIVLNVTRGDESIRTRVDLQLEATQVLRQITTLLKASGPQENNLDFTKSPPQGNGKFDPGEYPAFCAYTAGSAAPKWSSAQYLFLNNSAVPLGASGAYPANAVITPLVPLTDPDIYPTVPTLQSAGGTGTQIPGQIASGASSVSGPLSCGTNALLPYVPPQAPGSQSTNIVEIAFRVPKSLGGPAPVGDPSPIKLQPINLNNGAVEWGTEVFVIALAPAANYQLDVNGNQMPGYFGNELQLRYYNAATGTFDRKIVMGRNVERILFEAYCTGPSQGAVSGFYGTGNYDSSLGQNEMRVTLWLVKRDPNGNIVKVKASNTFNFRSIIR